jgi:FlaA1/EpsC-like NDP-sugar epimerase
MAVFTAFAILIWLLLFACTGLYDARRLANAAEEFKLVLQAVASGTVGAAVAAFALKVPTQRSWVLAAWAACTVTVLSTRFAYRAILRWMRRCGIIVSRMPIVGAGREGRDLCRSITRTRRLGLQVIGFRGAR